MLECKTNQFISVLSSGGVCRRAESIILLKEYVSEKIGREKKMEEVGKKVPLGLLS